LLTTTHLIVAVFLGMFLTLNRNEWFVALMFGVLLDADHLFALPRYVHDNGWYAILRPSWDDGSGLPYKSLLHYPVGVMIVAPLSIGWRLFLPLTFWALHLTLDWVQTASHAYSAPVESAVLAIACIGIFWISYSRWNEVRDDGSMRGYVSHIRSRTSEVFGRGRVAT